jgi:Domain of unknown function (DUF4157)
MSKSAKASKAARSTDSDAPAHDSRGHQGASLAAPPSGMHFVDHASPASGHAVLQTKQRGAPAQGLPPALRHGIETLSGMSLDNVRVHYNSAQPANVGALAYAQGSDIHVAPGQEPAVPHEAWHVVQQAQGRVRPTLQAKGGPAVNDQPHLEREADTMGARALSIGRSAAPQSGLSAAPPAATGSDAVIQCWPGFIDRWLQKRRGFTPVEDPDQPLVQGSKVVGHQAQTATKTVKAKRRDKFAEGAVQVGTEAAKMGLDALGTATTGVPIGSVVGGAMSAHSVASSGRDAYRDTGNSREAVGAVGKAVLKEGVGEALGNIPVIGEFIGMVEGLGMMAYSVFQSDQSRFEEKQTALENLLAKKPVIDEARQRLAVGDLEADSQRRLEKAVQRYEEAVAAGREWQQGKMAKGTAPLTMREVNSDD